MPAKPNIKSIETNKYPTSSTKTSLYIVIPLLFSKLKFSELVFVPTFFAFSFQWVRSYNWETFINWIYLTPHVMNWRDLAARKLYNNVLTTIRNKSHNYFIQTSKTTWKLFCELLRRPFIAGPGVIPIIRRSFKCNLRPLLTGCLSPYS